jgi:hypothetical protein
MASSTAKFPLLDGIAAACGGRRIFGIIWFSWCYSAFAAFLFFHRDDRQISTGLGAGVYMSTIIVVGILVFIMLRGLLFRKYRGLLLERVAPTTKPGRTACFFLRVLPVLSVVMLIWQWILRP